MTPEHLAGEPRTSLARFLEGLVRLGADVDLALTGIAAVLKVAPSRPRLSDDERSRILEDGATSEEQLQAAEDAVSSGSFAYDLVDQFVIGIASSLTDAQCRQLLGLDQSQLDRLYDAGLLIGRSTGDSTSTPGWLVDTSQDDGLIPHVAEILSEDAPYFFLAFGRAVYEVRDSLVSEGPMPPERWLARGLDPAAVVAAIAALPFNEESR